MLDMVVVDIKIHVFLIIGGREGGKEGRRGVVEGEIGGSKRGSEMR